MRIASEDLGTHQAKRRRLTLDGNEFGVSNQPIAAGGFVTSNPLYSPGFVHFHGSTNITTPASTTVEIRVQPGNEGNTLFAAEEFTVTVLTTFAAATPNRYTFYWGIARGVILGALGSGSSYVRSDVFRFIIRNTGGSPVDLLSLVHLECL